jgi:hypothetical protein
MCTICGKNFSCKDKLKHHVDVKHEHKKLNFKSKSKSPSKSFSSNPNSSSGHLVDSSSTLSMNTTPSSKFSTRFEYRFVLFLTTFSYIIDVVIFYMFFSLFLINRSPGPKLNLA